MRSAPRWEALFLLGPLGTTVLPVQVKRFFVHEVGKKVLKASPRTVLMGTLVSMHCSTGGGRVSTGDPGEVISALDDNKSLLSSSRSLTWNATPLLPSPMEWLNRNNTVLSAQMIKRQSGTSVWLISS